MEARGVRLQPNLWNQIDIEAKRLRLKPTDYLRRRIEDAFSFDPDARDERKTAHTAVTPEPIPWSSPDGDDQ